MSVTDETSHDPIVPCGALEQSVDSLRHSTMAAWSSAVDFGAHSVVGIPGATRLVLRVRVRVKLRVEVRVNVKVK